jgi:hypothetical protein
LFIAGDTVNVRIQSVAEEDLVKIKDFLGLLLSVEIVALDVSVAVEQLLDPLVDVLIGGVTGVKPRQ